MAFLHIFLTQSSITTPTTVKNYDSGEMLKSGIKAFFSLPNYTNVNVCEVWKVYDR